MQILGRLFRDANVQAPSPHGTDELERQLARVLRVNPCLRRAHGYEEHLRTALACSSDQLGRLVAALPPPRRLDDHACGSDPCLRALNLTPDQVAAALADAGMPNGILIAPSPEDDAHAVLGIDATRGQARVICGSGRTGLQGELVDRLIDELALEALEIVAQEASTRDMLDCERALLEKRLGILRRMDIGMRPLTGGRPQDGTGTARLDTLLDQSDHDLRGLGLLPDAFDDQLRRFCDVLLRPDLHVHIASRVEATATQAGVVRLAGRPPRELAMLLVRVAAPGIPRPANDRHPMPRRFG